MDNSMDYLRAASNSRSTDDVRSELGIDRKNPRIARHFVWSFTDSFREILIFDYCKSYNCLNLTG